jgi:hypothetical protein
LLGNSRFGFTLYCAIAQKKTFFENASKAIKAGLNLMPGGAVTPLI